MIQDIAPDALYNPYLPRAPRAEDHLLLFDEEGRQYVRIGADGLRFPRVGEVSAEGAVYLFSVNATGFFLAPRGTNASLPGFGWKNIRELRDEGSGAALYAAFTGWHLWRWYADNRCCGRCGAPNALHPKERALQCTCCGQIVYPRINPAVIVGVIRGDSLLITRYRSGYAHNALVAGFTEIGETLEETVAREVREETGLRVRNIRYYRSQPWGIAQDILAGFYCDAEGGGRIRMEETELCSALWTPRQEIELQPNDYSLTNEMMRVFREGREPR